MTNHDAEVTVSVPMNIALIKYWGKRDEELILPLNDSISLTVDELRATTTIRMIEGGSGKSTVTINGEQLESLNKRYERVFQEATRVLRKRKDGENKAPGHFFQVTSTTNFPVAAGLASSAAGFGAMAMGFKSLLNLDDATANRMARIGSGSACRSMYPGLVQWKMGEREDGTDCFAERVDTSNWESLTCVILVFNDARKKIGSSEGMRRSRDTSTLLEHRLRHVVPERIEAIRTAYESRNFEQLAQLTMDDSNQFHAVCLDSRPPIRYLNEASWHLIETVEDFNRESTRVAYTFDAGPNACVLMEKQNVMDFLKIAVENFEIDSEDVKRAEEQLGEHLETSNVEHNRPFKCSKLIVSTMGGGPKIGA